MNAKKQIEILKIIKSRRYVCTKSGVVYTKSDNHGGLGIKKIMRPTISKDGYLILGLTGDKKRYYLCVHQFIYLYFNGRFSELKEINHIDGNKKNNSLNNLELLTPSENQKHSYRIGLSSQNGIKNNLSKLNEQSVRAIRLLAKNGISRREIANKFNTCTSNIGFIILKKRWAHVE